MFLIFKIGFGLGATKSLLSVFINNEKLLHLIHASDDDLNGANNKFTHFLVNSPKKLSPSQFSPQNQDSNHSIVTYFISKYQKLAFKSLDYWVEVLDFLIALCKFNDHGVNVNQMMISEAFLEGPGEMFLLQIDLLKTENKLQVRVKQGGKELKYELIELFESISGSKNSELISIGVYLKKQLQLLSNLCYGRNYVNIKILKKIFKMHVLMEYIWNEKLPEDFRAIFVSLLLNMHIDIKPRTERLAPQLSKKLLKISGSEEKENHSFTDLQNSLFKKLTVVGETKKEEKNMRENFMSQKSQIAKSARQKIYDVVVDINRIKNVTGNLKMLGKKIDNSGVEMAPEMKETLVEEFNPEILFDIFKDDELINEEQIKSLMDKILYYLEDEVKKSDKMKIELSEDVRKNERIININFNSLTLNIVEMVKKLVYFECFTQNKSYPSPHKLKKKSKEQKNNLENDFVRLMKALIDILSIEKKQDIDDKPILNRSSGNSRNPMAAGSFRVAPQNNISPINSKNANKEKLNAFDDFNSILSSSIKKKFIRTFDESKKLSSDNEVGIDVKVKMEIIKVLIFLLEIRQDDFINIIIDFINSSIEELFKSETVYSEPLIQKAIQTNIQSYLPTIFPNGLKVKYPEVKLNYNLSKNHNLDKITKTPLLPTLLYIFQFSQDYNLNYLVLKLIFQMFSQRQKLIKSLKQVHLIINQTDQLLFEYLKTRALHLRFIAEQSEVWLVPPDKLDDVGFKYKFVIYQVRDLLIELISFFYNSFNMNENHEVGFYERMFNERNDDDINKTRQTMLKDLSLHSIILSLLKDGSYVLEYIEERTEKNEIILQLFETCYRFLLIFVKKEHKLNKKSLMPEIDFFVRSMEYFEVGQSDLLCEIYKNNYKLSLDLTDDLLSVFLKKISTKTKSNYGHDPNYLKFFENIMFDKKEPITVNIHRLINFIFDSNRRFEFLCLIENPFYIKRQLQEKNDEEDSEPDIRSLWGHHIFDFNKEKTLYPYIYQAKALDILVNCLNHCEDKQLLKLNIQKTFNLNYIFKLLSTDDIYFNDNNLNILHSILKTPLFRLLRLVWLDSVKPSPELNNNKGLIKFIKKQQELLKIIGRKDIEEIKRGRKSTIRSKLSKFKSEEYESDDDDDDDDKEDLNEEDILIEGPSLMMELERNEKMMSQQAIHNKVAESFRKKYTFDFIANLFENVLPLMIELMKKLVINERNIENFEDRSDLNKLYEYGETFAAFLKTNLNNSEIKKYKDNNLLEEFEKYFYIQLEYNNLNHNLESDKEVEEPTEWNLLGANSKIQNEELPLNNILPDKHKGPVNYAKEEAWRVYLLNLLINPELKAKYIIIERKALIEAIKQIADLDYSEIVNEYLQKKHQKMSMEMLIKKLVNFFKVWAEESPTIKDQVIINLIEILQDLIESYDSEDDRLKIQNLMDKCGLTDTIFSYLCAENVCTKVVESLILLCISLLQGGNSQVQETIFNYLTKYSNSENFFSTLYSIINDQISFRNKKKSHYEKIDMCFKQLSFSYKTSTKFGTEKVLRLLQLFTENHNSSLQNYLRYQINSRNNYDILGLTVKILESCLFELNEHNYQMASQCFDTLTEFIQGPCEANQLALVETPFTNIASELLELNDSIIQTQKQIKKKNKIMQLLKRRKNKKTKNQDISKFQSCSSDTSQMNVQSISIAQQNELESQKILVKYINSLCPAFAKELESSFERHSPLGFQNWMLTGLKFKCVITIESLCEGQKNNDILKKIMKNLSLDILKDNLGWIFEKKQKLYGDKYTWNVYKDSDERLESKGFMLATGFKIFIILRKYLELGKPGEEDEEDYEDILLLKKEFSEVLASENIVSQLGHFGIDLIKTGVNAVESIFFFIEEILKAF